MTHRDITTPVAKQSAELNQRIKIHCHKKMQFDPQVHLILKLNIFQNVIFADINEG